MYEYADKRTIGFVIPSIYFMRKKVFFLNGQVWEESMKKRQKKKKFECVLYFLYLINDLIQMYDEHNKRESNLRLLVYVC